MPQAIQTLNLYRRHASDCAVNKSRIPVKQRKFFMDCQCPIWIYGHTPTGDTVPRQSTKTTDLKIAEGVRDSLLARPIDASPVHGFGINECIEKYLAAKGGVVTEKTVGQNRKALERLSRYAASRGAVYVGQLTGDLLEDFKTAGLPSDMKMTTKAHAIAKVRCFLKVAYLRKWTKEPLVHQTTPLRAIYEQKEPYTDDEVTKILDESLNLNGATHAYAKHPATFRLLLELMLETGMRVGDAIHFNPAKLSQGESLWVYTFKPQKQRRAERQKTLEAFISDRLKRAIGACKWLSPELPFRYGTFASSYLGGQVYERMQTIGERCGVADCRPHRLRDTFAVRRLLHGMHLEDVSRLLGHSSVKVTEQYYAKWVTSRKQRLEKLLAESFVDVV